MKAVTMIIVRAVVTGALLAALLSFTTPLRSRAAGDTHVFFSPADYGCGRYLTASAGPDSEHLASYFYTDSCNHQARAYATDSPQYDTDDFVDLYLSGPGVNTEATGSTSADTGYVTVSCGSSNQYQAQAFLVSHTSLNPNDGPVSAPPVPFQVC